jgi:hypothetical protein
MASVAEWDLQTETGALRRRRDGHESGRKAAVERLEPLGGDGDDSPLPNRSRAPPGWEYPHGEQPVLTEHGKRSPTGGVCDPLLGRGERGGHCRGVRRSVTLERRLRRTGRVALG